MKSANRFNSISPGWNIAISIALCIVAVICLAPMLLVIIISLSTADSLAYNGYTFFPSGWSFQAYGYLVQTGRQILQGYKITIAYTVVNTVLALFVMSMFSYVIAQKNFRMRKAFTMFAFFTMLFSGGLVPSYILNVKYLHLYDTFWIFVLPGLMSFYNCIILRTFINTTIPDSLFEAAKIDGAGHFRIYFQIVLPLFKAGLATIGLFKVVGNWNDWFTGKLYIENPDLIPLQTMLTRIMDNIQFIKDNASKMNDQTIQAILKDMPTESSRMAITVITVAPILFAYPFFQRYFVQGLTIGSVKG
ncbi:MAG: carbohydrate ABC transporter permease [Clostridiaceae bacterium]|nr:carbohydrate ABC transporter permease [Clostridiaceae bacterium]